MKMKRYANSGLILLVLGLLCLGTTHAMAQTTAPGGTEVTPPPEGPMTDPPLDEPAVEEPANATNPPGYIDELMGVTELKQEQVDQMRADGLGWGEIRIATRLAERMAAGSNGALTFDAALAQVLTARAEGKGFGQIAAENNLKVGDLVGNKKAKDSGNPESEPAGDKTARQKKPGLLARIGKALGLGKSDEKPVKPAKAEKPEQSVRMAKNDRPERPARAERSVRVERAERPERPSRPEKPEKGPNK